jgi:hypothetical protein
VVPTLLGAGAASFAADGDGFDLEIVLEGVTVDRRTGVATVTATNYCDVAQADGDSGGFLVEQGAQNAGASVAPGCSPDGTTWTLSTAPGEAQFHPGRLTVTITNLVVSEAGTADASLTATVIAKGTR